MNWLQALEFSARNGCAYLRLPTGVCHVLDEGDLEWANNYKWYGYDGYALSWRRDAGTVRLHRLVMGAGRGDEIDHRDGVKWDSRKRNLRFCTRSQNKKNSKPNKTKRSLSKYKGVDFSLRSPSRPWRVRGTNEGKTVTIGRYDTELVAAHAYDRWALESFGEFARINGV